MTTRDVKRSIAHIWGVFRRRGVRHLIRSGTEKLTAKPFMIKAQFRYCRAFRSRRGFVFGGEKYRYFVHLYNHTWRNERTVEVPIIWKIVQGNQGKQVLEVGNVLSHYFPVTHEVVDKFEKGNDVLNVDVVDFRSTKRYDLIVTISTLEHVGWDEDPEAKSNILAEPTKILRAIDNLKDHLAPGGQLVITVPMGLNPQLDKSLEDGRITFTNRKCLKRISRGNNWREVDWSECRGTKYGSRYRFANAVVIGVIANAVR